MIKTASQITAHLVGCIRMPAAISEWKFQSARRIVGTKQCIVESWNLCTIGTDHCFEWPRAVTDAYACVFVYVWGVKSRVTFFSSTNFPPKLFRIWFSGWLSILRRWSTRLCSCSYLHHISSQPFDARMHNAQLARQNISLSLPSLPLPLPLPPERKLTAATGM